MLRVLIAFLEFAKNIAGGAPLFLERSWTDFIDHIQKYWTGRVDGCRFGMKSFTGNFTHPTCRLYYPSYLINLCNPIVRLWRGQFLQGGLHALGCCGPRRWFLHPPPLTRQCPLLIFQCPWASNCTLFTIRADDPGCGPYSALPQLWQHFGLMNLENRENFFDLSVDVHRMRIMLEQLS